MLRAVQALAEYWNAKTPRNSSSLTDKPGACMLALGCDLKIGKKARTFDRVGAPGLSGSGNRFPPVEKVLPVGFRVSGPGRNSAEHMTKLVPQRVLLISCAVMLWASLWGTPGSAAAQRARAASPATNITVDSSEAMFTTMCALLAAGFEADVTAKNWHPLRAQLRERMQRQEGPAVEAVREFYKKHQLMGAGAMLSEYIWFGLVSGPAPKFKPILRRDELPPEVIMLEGFSEVLSAYYQEQKIGQLWQQVQPNYNREIDRLHDSAGQIVFVATNYLREMSSSTNARTFTIIVEPLVGRITNVRNFGDHYAIVLSGLGDVPADVVRHAYLHFLLDPLPLRYPHVVAAKRPLFEMAARAPRLAPDLKDDFPSFFTECTVRAVELKLKRMSPSEREAAMNVQDADGYVLVRPIYGVLANFEKSEPSMRLYFPEMVRAIDAAAEAKRLQAVNFAPAAAAPKTDETAESVARVRPQHPTTVPDDAEAIAALTEGERRIAEKNPRAAEASFQRVLAKYPDQPRAWYGLGLVALLDHDGARAVQVFARLTSGEHAASRDPMVLAWAHVYLGRIYEDNGQAEQAKTEYRAALLVDGGPEQARQAARKELAAVESKPSERP
jgi:tetratricopeptide (TPR) repeat protein